jgi:TATA-box binding protein (TBP) (component of TFIID and TFIIIB)
MNVKVENIFCCIDFKQYLDICDEKAEDAGLEATRNLSAYVYTHPKLKTEMMIFFTGKVFLNGAKNQGEIASSFWALTRKLKEIGVKVTLGPHTEIEIMNVLATANIHDYLPDLEVDLERISMKHNAIYNPKEFPSVFLSFLPPEVKGTALIFKSGRVLVGDVRSPEDADLILERVIETVRY